MADPVKPDDTQGAVAQSMALAFRFLFIVVGVLGLGWLFSNFSLVPPDKRAVVIQFGSVSYEQHSGILMALPSPFAKVLMLPSLNQQVEFKIQPFLASANLQSSDGQPAYLVDSDPRLNTGMLLTGNMNVIHLDATVFYQITNAADYVLSGSHVTPALERLVIASAVTVCSSRDLDSILVARPELAGTTDASRNGREHLRTDLLSEINRRLADLEKNHVGIGITVTRVDLIPSIPGEARAAFNSVLLAMQGATTAQANARTQAELTSQKADQDKDRQLADTQASADERIANAKTHIAATEALSRDNAGLRGDTLANQIFSQRIGGILGKAGQVVTVAGNGGRVILPGTPK